MSSEQNRNSDTIFPREFPGIYPDVFSTENDVLYLKHPGAILIAAPAVNIQGMRRFLQGFPAEYGFEKYIDDPDNLAPAELLVKVAGQVCYASWGPKRSWNKDAASYFRNIITSGHGSVLEHANFSVILYGISRSTSHEIVRHRAGVGFSQLSQRYVSGRVLRFVERAEYQNDPTLHEDFIQRIDRAAQLYEKIAEYLYQKQRGGEIQLLSADSQTDLRKKVQQTARSILPNETETIMVMTANLRAWRHIISMRVSEHAETEIRAAMFNVFLILRQVAPAFFEDFEVVDLSDGTKVVKTPYPKV